MTHEELILDYLKRIDSDIKRIDSDLKDLKTDLRDIKEDIRADRRKLDEVYEARERVKISFGWQWGAISFSLAIFAAFLGGGIAITFFS